MASLGFLVLIVVVLPVVQPAAQAQARRALVVGIDTYLADDPEMVRSPRRLTNLTGAVNDAEAMAQLLRDAYGFEVDLLLEREATRDTLLARIDQLVRATQKDDEVVFFFAGHGSAVRNSKSPGGRDETLVPADALWGAPDLRDKELRRLFNIALERQGRLTILLDSCHSGSAVRGLPGHRERRFAAPVTDDVADGAATGPPLERAALILAAAGKDEVAFSVTTRDGKSHGLFTYSLLEALGYAESRESAGYVFLRARSRLRAEGYDQNPVILGPKSRREASFFGGRSSLAPHAAATVLAVEDDGGVHLDGGWATGLSQGSILRRVDAEGERTPYQIQLVEVGLTRSLGRPHGRAPEGFGPGRDDLFVLEEWAVPQQANLRVHMAAVGFSAAELRALALQVTALSSELGVTWVADPVAEAPSHVLTWQGGRWHVIATLDAGREIRHDLGPDLDSARLRRVLPTGAKLFLQLPAPRELRREIHLGHGTVHDGIEVVDDPAEAIYVLTGRFHEHELHYSWVRPDVVSADDTGVSSLPLATRWKPLGNGAVAAVEVGSELQDLAARLGRIRAWQTLESPDGESWPYRLALKTGPGEMRRGVGSVGTLEGGGSLAPRLVAGEEVGVVLELPEAARSRSVPKRYIYVFFVDSSGESKLIFPVDIRDCSVDNHLPLGVWEPELVLEVGCQPVLRVQKPLGIDTYFLLTTSDPLVDPNVLNSEGVRGPEIRDHPLQSLLRNRGVTTRSAPQLVPTEWSIRRVVFETVSQE